MPATGNAVGRGRLKALIVVLLLVGLMVGLAACRGFFGQAPIALLIVVDPLDPEVPVEVTFDISGSNDPDGTIVTYDVDFGDGSTHATGTDLADVITHEYMVGGTYTVKLIVIDNHGRTGMATETMIIGPAMITFASNRGGDYDIWRMKADGTDQKVVLNTDPDDELFPDLVLGTRDKIAYAAARSTWNIWTMTVEGLSDTKLAPTQTTSNQIQPSWSQDASEIAYASNTTGVWEIWTMNANGTSQAQLTTQSPSWAIAPTYSPVNDNILFVSDKTANGGSGIWLWNAATSSANELYDSTGRDGDASPAGFPSGLTTPLGLPVGAGISKPAWSPDGTKIAFSTDKDGDIDIYVMDANGTTNIETLETYVNSLLGSAVTIGTITSSDDEFCPYWLEDGSGLAFVKAVGGVYDIYKVSFSSGAVTKLTSTGENASPAERR